MTRPERPVALIAKDTDRALGLRTGYPDDRRQELTPDLPVYAVFKSAHARQDSWTDEEHREFWVTHLGIWPGKPGNRSNVDALAFGLAAGASDGFTFDQVVAELPGRTRDDLRDRGVLERAQQMFGSIESPPAPPSLPAPALRDGVWSIPGPAHPAVVLADRLWRLPRVFANDDQGQEEAQLPPPGAGWINLPRSLGNPHAFKPVGQASLGAYEEVAGALSRLRDQRAAASG